MGAVANLFLETDKTERLLEYWGAWLRSIPKASLGYPKEVAFSKSASYDQVIAKAQVRDFSTLTDDLGLAIDKAVLEMPHPLQRKVLQEEYWKMAGLPVACKRLRLTEEVYGMLLRNALQWLVPQLRSLEKYV